jgi:hypothetical protein
MVKCEAHDILNGANGITTTRKVKKKWAYLGSNQGPTDYESVALTN